MSLTTTSNRVVATGDGVTVTFNFNRLLYDTTHLEVYKAGVLQTTGYTVNGVPGTSTSVTFSVAPANLAQIILLRVVPITQLSVYGVSGAFPAATTEKNFDLTVMGLQQFDEILDRAVTIPVTSTLTATTFPDPGLAANYGQGVKIKADGTGLDIFTINAGDIAGTLTTKGDILGYSGAVSRVPIGTDGQVLQADSTAGLGLKWSSDQISKTIVDAKGDLIVATADDTVARKAVGAAGTVLMARSADTSGLAYIAALNSSGYGDTSGPGDGAGGGDLVDDVTLSAGGCIDVTNAYWIQGTAITKRLDEAWAVGTNAGGMDVAFPTSTVTITIASPGVVSWTAHGVANDTVIFTTTGTLPTGFTAGTKYYIISAGLTADAFEVAATSGGAAINTSGTQSGTHTATGFYSRPYYLFRIVRSDTGVVDALFSLSATAPTMPTNYDFKRLRGYLRRVAGTIVAFHTYETEGGGMDYAWDSPTLDIDLQNTLTTSRRTDAVKVPLHFSVVAHLNVAVDDASAATAYWICCPDQTDLAPSATAAPLGTGRVHVAGAVDVRGPVIVRTSATGTIAARTTVATADSYRVATLGFTWARRN